MTTRTEDLLQLTRQVLIIRGGPTSGNWGHISSSRRGKHGGSDKGGGLGAVGLAPGASRKEIVSASKKERGARAEGVVKVSPKAVAEAQATVAKARVKRDQALGAQSAVEVEIAKAQALAEKETEKGIKIQQKLFASMDKIRDIDKELRPVFDQQSKLGDDLLDLPQGKQFDKVLGQFEANDKKLKRLQGQKRKAQENREKLAAQDRAQNTVMVKRDAALKAALAKSENMASRDAIMTNFFTETEAESEILFQHNLNEAKRVRAELKNIPRARAAEVKKLETALERQSNKVARINKAMQKANFPDNDPRAMAMINQSLNESAKIFDINAQLFKAKERDLTQARNLVKVDNPTKLKTAPGSQREKHHENKADGSWKTGINNFESVVSEDVLPRGALVRYRHTDTGRAFQRNGAISEVHMSDFAGADTMAHELGHTADNYNKRLLKRSTDWMNGRTQGEKNQKLSDLTGNKAYNNSEVAKPDKFYHPYIGKEYNGLASEVFSMGIDMMSGDPGWLAERDPDMFDFIYAQARTP